MGLPEQGNISLDIPKIEVIRHYKKWGCIKNGSPLWWSTDYPPDPREYLSFDEFLKRLVHLGEYQTVRTSLGWEKHKVKTDVYLYPEPKVPMAILNLEVFGQNLPFLVTARPYCSKEQHDRPLSSLLLKFPSVTEVSQYVKSGGEIDLLNCFYPHIRGLFVSKRGNLFFWYPVRYSSSYKENLYDGVRNALKKQNLSFIEIYETPGGTPYGEERSYAEVWMELGEKNNLVDQRTPLWFDSPYSEVSAEEFLADYRKIDQDLVVIYPLNLKGIKNTLPLVIAARTHKESRIRKPVVLGIFAENGKIGRCRRGGILRIKNRQLAKEISRLITQDWGITIDTVLFTPQKGRPKYERVPGN